MADKLKRRDVLKGLGGLAAAAGVARPFLSADAQRRFDGEPLHVQFWAGSEGQTIRSGVVEPFMQKSGAKVVVTEGWTSASIAKLRAEKANPSTSVYLMDDIGVVTTGRENLLEPMDLARLPNAIDVQPRFFVEGKGVRFFTYVTGLAYNTEIVKTPPTSWKDLWDPTVSTRARSPSRRQGRVPRSTWPSSRERKGASDGTVHGDTVGETRRWLCGLAPRRRCASDGRDRMERAHAGRRRVARQVWTGPCDGAGGCQHRGYERGWRIGPLSFTGGRWRHSPKERQWRSSGTDRTPRVGAPSCAMGSIIASRVDRTSVGSCSWTPR
jgi:hypothetical protein